MEINFNLEVIALSRQLFNFLQRGLDREAGGRASLDLLHTPVSGCTRRRLTRFNILVLVQHIQCAVALRKLTRMQRFG